MFKDLIYDKFPECSSPCQFMKIDTHLTSQYTEEKSATKFFFPKEVKITSEKLKKSFSSAGKFLTLFYEYQILFFPSFLLFIVAEVGGYLGMVLGVSLMDLEIVAKILISSLNNINLRKFQILK